MIHLRERQYPLVYDTFFWVIALVGIITTHHKWVVVCNSVLLCAWSLLIWNDLYTRRHRNRKAQS